MRCLIVVALCACGGRTEPSLRSNVSAALDCPAPETVVLAREERGFYHLALDETHVYWAVDGKVRRVSKCGGTPETVAVVEPSNDLDVKGGFVYFGEHKIGGRVLRAPVAGGTISAVFGLAGSPENVVASSDFAYASALAGIDGTFVYQLAAGPTGGGPASIRRSGIGRYVTSDDDFVYVADEGEFGIGDEAIVRLAHGSGAAKVVVARAPARDFTVDDTHLYWLQPTPSDGSPIRIMSAPKDSGVPVAELAVTDTYALRIAADPLDAASGGRVYFTNHGEGSVMGVAKSGGTLITISDEVPVAEDVGADETSVYFISFENRTLSRRDAPR